MTTKIKKIPESLTTEKLGELMLQTVKQMSPEEKAEVRWYLDLEMRAYLATRRK